jgi:hypothetical protein
MSVNKNFAVALRVVLLNPHVKQAAPCQHIDYIEKKTSTLSFKKTPKIVQDQVSHKSWLFYLTHETWKSDSLLSNARYEYRFQNIGA